VRGICCLRPGIPGVSDQIRVTTVVDRFLEHTRVFAFGVGDRTEVLLSSADWMTRNLQRRIEVAVPIDDPALRARVLDEVLGFALKDTVKARQLMTDGTLAAVAAGNGASAPGFQSQLQLCEAARRAAEQRAPDLRPAAPPEPVPSLEPRTGAA
jgi:polyphosphate kinase